MKEIVNTARCENKMLKARLFWLDIIKGIGIILVLIGHIYLNPIVCNWLYSFHMPLFFLAGGIVYKERTVLNDLKRRIQTIMIPYFSFGVLVLIYWHLIERRFRDSDLGFFDSLMGGLLFGQYVYLEFNVHLWFLPCFFTIAVIYNVLMNIGGKKLSFIVAGAMSVVYIVVALPRLPMSFDCVFKYIGFYAVGNVLADRKVEWRIEEWKTEVKIVVSVILLTLNFVLSYRSLTKGIMWFLTGLIGAVSIYIFSILIVENGILQYLGRISLVILCIHGPVYRVLVKIVSIPLDMTTDAVRENFILAMLIVVLTLAVCSLVNEVVVRKVPWIAGKCFTGSTN